MGVEPDINDLNLQKALARNDLAAVGTLLVSRQFVLIHLPDNPSWADGSDASDEIDEIDEIEDELGALTAERNGRDYLVAFTDQDQATEFVESRSDLFEADSEVTGFWVEGATLLDYLDDDLGLLLNPDGKGHRQIEASVIRRILDELNLE